MSDLTDFERTNLDRLIVSIGVPSAEIRKGYETYNFRTKTQGVIIAVISKVNDDGWLVKAADGKEFEIKKSDLKDVSPNPKKLEISLMPEGLFDGKSDDDIRNLIEYLKSVPIVAAKAEVKAPEAKKPEEKKVEEKK